MSKILVIDGHNFMHRARSGFAKGEFNIVFNFFRNLRALVEMHAPTRIVFALEGHPQFRYDLMSEYKANRVVEQGTKKHEEMVDFHRQKSVIIENLKFLPVSVVRHSEFECDDVIFNLIKRSWSSNEWIVASNDSDFTQLLDRFDHVKLYNPMKKEFVDPVDYDYVVWKSLRGDASDNVPAIKGVSDSRAKLLAADFDKLHEFINSSDEIKQQFERNYKLISFYEWNDEEALKMTSSQPQRNWEALRASFQNMKFESITNDKSWDKFVSTFERLW